MKVTGETDHGSPKAATKQYRLIASKHRADQLRDLAPARGDFDGENVDPICRSARGQHVMSEVHDATAMEASHEGLEGESMSAARSSIPKVIGILMIIFASLGLLFSLIGFGGTDFSTEGLSPEFVDKLNSAKTFQLVTSVLGLVIGALHLFTGIACVRYKSTAPKLALIYGVAAILNVIIGLIVMYTFVKPALDVVPGAGAALGAVFLIIGIIGMAWPIIVLALMTRPAAKAACVN